MTWVNARIPSAQDIRKEQEQNALATERDFWRKKTEQLQRELENIFEHAKENGMIELHHCEKILKLTLSNKELNQ